MEEEKMTDLEIQRFIQLLQKWRRDELNWGDCCELREMKHRFSDTIDLYFKNF